MTWYIEHVPAPLRLLITVCVVLLAVLLFRRNKDRIRAGLKEGDRVRLRNGVSATVLSHPAADILEVRLDNGNGTFCLLKSVSPVAEKKKKN